jgi:hypothetical protein
LREQKFWFAPFVRQCNSRMTGADGAIFESKQF